MKKNMAFTLVELIVVITILAILLIISFFSFQGYSRSSRDSVRIADLSSIKNSLEIFNIEAGKYPPPSNSSFITFSGGIVWEQGSFGKSTLANVEKLNKIPTDPLFDKEYTYSITENKNQYQLGGISEGSNFSNSNLITASYAGDASAYALVIGNYNGLITKTSSGNLCYVLTVPSIMANDIESSTDYKEIVDNERLIFDGYKNIPYFFKDTKFKIDGGFTFNPKNLIVYTDNESCKSVETDENLRLDILKKIQESYSGTILQEESMYSKLLSLSVNEGTLQNSNNVIGLASNIGRIISGKRIVTSYSTDGTGNDGGDYLDDLMGLCNIDGNTINNGDIITTYSENLIDASETYDCQSVSENRTCTDGNLSGDETSIYTTCVKGTPDNCIPVSSYSYNSHIYSVPAINHTENLSDLDPGYLVSQQISESNGKYTYKLNNLLCNDGTLINPIEDINPEFVSCDYGYILVGGVCESEGTVDITSTDTVACPYCAP